MSPSDSDSSASTQHEDRPMTTEEKEVKYLISLITDLLGTVNEHTDQVQKKIKSYDEETLKAMDSDAFERVQQEIVDLCETVDSNAKSAIEAKEWEKTWHSSYAILECRSGRALVQADNMIARLKLLAAFRAAHESKRREPLNDDETKEWKSIYGDARDASDRVLSHRFAGWAGKYKIWQHTEVARERNAKLNEIKQKALAVCDIADKDDFVAGYRKLVELIKNGRPIEQEFLSDGSSSTSLFDPSLGAFHTKTVGAIDTQTEGSSSDTDEEIIIAVVNEVLRIAQAYWSYVLTLEKVKEELNRHVFRKNNRIWLEPSLIKNSREKRGSGNLETDTAHSGSGSRKKGKRE
jgi:hypothetical protein